jgi:nicotinamidase-related amidase
METGSIGPDIGKSALIIVDMQNDFLHRDGNFSHIAREHPEAQIDLPFSDRNHPQCEKARGCVPGSRKTCRVPCARAEARLFGRGVSVLACGN